MSQELTTILLCGGKGERLRPFTDTLPKPLVTLNGKPILLHLLRYLSLCGVRQFVACVGYKAEAIEEFIAQNAAREKWNIRAVNSGDASMTDRILDARPHATGRALVCYGDTLANIDLADLISHHESTSAIATLSVYPLQSPFGIVQFDEQSRIVSFAEKPVLPYWVNIGFLLLEPEAMNLLQRGSDMVQFLGSLVQTGRFNVYRHEGRHLTINTEKERAMAEAQVGEFFTVLDGHAQ